MVREQLQRWGHDHRREQLRGARHEEHVLGVAFDLGVAFRRDGDDRSAPRPNLLDVREHLRVHVALRRDRHDGHPLLYEGDRAVLQLTGRVALGVDV